MEDAKLLPSDLVESRYLTWLGKRKEERGKMKFQYHTAGPLSVRSKSAFLFSSARKREKAPESDMYSVHYS